VLEFLLQLDDPLLTALEVEAFLAEFALERLLVLHGVLEGSLPLLFFHPPGHSDLFDFLNFSLLEVCFELGLLGPLPHFKLPNGLIIGATSGALIKGRQIGVANRRRPARAQLDISGLLERINLFVIFGEAQVLQIEEGPQVTLEVTGSRVSEVEVVIVYAHLRRRRLLQRSRENLAQRNRSHAQHLLLTSRHLVNGVDH